MGIGLSKTIKISMKFKNNHCLGICKPIFFLSVFLCFNKGYADSLTKHTDFFIEQIFKYPYVYSISAGVNNPVYEGRVSIKTIEENSKITLFPDVLSLRFSPLFYKDKKKIIPALSFFFGGLNKANFIKICSEPAFSSMTTSYSGIKFLPDRLIKISAANKFISAGAELNLKNFNFAFFTEKNSTYAWNDLNFCFAYGTEDLYDGNIGLGIVLYSSLYHDLYTKFTDKTPQYHQIYSSMLNFYHLTENGEYRILLLGSLKKPYKNKKINSAGRAEFDFLWYYFGLNTGVSLQNDNFSDEAGSRPQNSFVYFVQPKLLMDLIQVKGLYNIYRKKNIELLCHYGGLDINIAGKNIEFNTGLFYKDEKWSTDLEFKLKKTALWQELFSVKCKFIFENKKKNPFILKQYSSDFVFKVRFYKNIQTGITFSLAQAASVRNKNNLPPSAKWNKPTIESSVYFKYSLKRSIFNHSFSAEIKIKSENPKIGFALAYKIGS